MFIFNFILIFLSQIYQIFVSKKKNKIRRRKKYIYIFNRNRLPWKVSLILPPFFYKFFFIAAVKRLMREAQELNEATEEYCAHPLDDNLFEWHFTVHGPPSTDFEGGVYHGRILLPPEYPMKPPNIILLTVSYADQSFSLEKKKI